MVLYLKNLLDLFIDMSFYIVIGLVFTGLLYAFVKKDAILKHIGKDNTSSVVKASVVGVPLPLCSCGVVPTAMYLGKSGASKGSVVSFLTSTPQTGVDSIIATYGMLGPVFAAYRAVSAFFSGIISGVITNVLCKNDSINYEANHGSCGCSNEHKKEDSCNCCSHEKEEKHYECNCSSHKDENKDQKCSCSHEHNKGESFLGKIKIAFKYAFGEFLDEIALHFVIGLLIAALISTLLPASILSGLKNPILSMILMVIVGIPMYICSTASIPIAVSLMMKGISPGSAFVFLFAGPVTNIASLAILVKSLGKKVTAIYLLSASLCAIAFGLLFDYIIKVTGYTGVLNLIHNSHEHQMPIYMYIVAAIFGILLIKSLIKRFIKKSTSACGCDK